MNAVHPDLTATRAPRAATPVMSAADAARRPAASPRDPALDLLRSVALVRIVLWHLFAATWMTWFAAIPVMFFVAGSLLGPAQRGYARFVRRRLRRILLPLWLYSGVVAVAYLLFVGGGRPSTSALGRSLAWIVPVVDPTTGGWDAGWLSNHLWYLRAYLWILLLAPVLVAAAKRIRLTVAVTIAAVVGLELAARSSVPVVGSGTARVLLGDTIVYGCFATLGIAYRQRDRRPERTHLAAAAVACGLGAVAYALLHGLPAEGVNASYPVLGLVGLGWLAALGLAEQPIRRVATRPTVERITRMISSRSLTVYLWHPVCIVLARRLLPSGGLGGALAVMIGTAGFVLLVVGLVGWDEALAARAHASLQGLGRVKPVAGVVAVTALLGAALPTLTGSSALALQGGSATVAPTFAVPAPSARDALADAAFAPATTVPVATTPPTAVTTTTPATTLPLTTLPVTTLPATTLPATTTSTVASLPVRNLRLVVRAAPAVTTTAPAATPKTSLRAPVPVAPTTAPRTAATMKATPSTSVARTTAPRRVSPSVRATTTTVARGAATNAGTMPAAGVSTTAASASPSTAPASPTTAPAATTSAPKGASAPTTAAPKTAALPAQVLQRALDAWRSSASPKITTMVVALRSGSQTWVAKSADGVITSRYQPDAPFLVASLTKTFTAALVLREVEKGTISLDDPVPAISGLDKALPAGITVRRLLTHTAGLVDYTAARGYRADTALTPIQAVNLSLAMPLQDGLGTTVRYANSGYLYLGLLLEQVTGKSYANLLAGIAADAGLQSTTLDVQPHPGWIGFSSGGVVATAADLATWGQALFTPGKLLSASGVSMLTTLGDMNLGLGTWPVCPCSTDANGVKRYTAIGHNTADGGLFYFPATGITIVAMFDPVTNDIVSLMSALDAAIKDN